MICRRADQVVCPAAFFEAKMQEYREELMEFR
jgi:hypothetical protein